LQELGPALCGNQSPRLIYSNHLIEDLGLDLVLAGDLRGDGSCCSALEEQVEGFLHVVVGLYHVNLERCTDYIQRAASILDEEYSL
jgi:hypothetical protein